MKRVYLALLLMLTLLVTSSFTVYGAGSYDVVPTTTLEGADLNATGYYNWNGEWDTNYGVLTITQNGDKITGNYPHDNGRIEGVAKGNMIYGQWYEDPNSSSFDRGDFEFVMSADGQSFIGHSRYESAQNRTWRGWNGERTSDDQSNDNNQSNDQVDDIPTTTLEGADLNATGYYNWNGTWNTNYGVLTITQNGDKITGNYASKNGRIEGVAKGNMIYGQWYEDPNSSSLNRGDFEFVMSVDGQSFIGHSRYENIENRNWRYLNGVRINDDQSNNNNQSNEQFDDIPTTTLEGADLNATGYYNWNGEWDTNYGVLTITQNGDKITGNYPHDNGRIEGVAKGNMIYGHWYEDPNSSSLDRGDFEFVMSVDGQSFIGHSRYESAQNRTWRGWNGERAKQETVDNQYSPWAKEEIDQAYDKGLVPDVLKDVDLRKPITRAEFAAVSVKVYEALSGTDALPATENPFIDTNDLDVLKAYNIGCVKGISSNQFAPDVLLNREQAATMLTRVFKRTTKPSWTIDTDDSFTLEYSKSFVFSDDADISNWAKDSVYFMVANNIINGMGNNMFAPKNLTDAQNAIGYANATREQALIIAVRMVNNLR